jgi:hypothetical protein
VPAGVALLLERRAGLAGGAGAGSRERVLRAFRLRPVADRAIGDRERLGDGDLGSERDILARCRVAHTVIPATSRHDREIWIRRANLSSE